MENHDEHRRGELLRSVKIGALSLPNNVFLAPMAGVTDLAMRILCREQGAGFSYTEMISAKGVHYKSKASFELACTVPEAGPTGVQIFGSEPEILAEAAELFVRGGAPLIDINMGCPMRKIVGNGDGSALMKDPELIEKIVAAVKRAVDVPVTVKLRRGFETGVETCVDCAKAAESGGADAVAVHGRYREEYYSGRSDRGCVERVKSAIGVPVILSGDVSDRRGALSALEETGADAVMIGRAANGNPWVFSEILSPETPRRTAGDVRSMIFRHLDLLISFKGEETAVSEIRKHVIWYVKGMKGSAKVRENVCRAQSTAEIMELLDGFFRTFEY